MRHKSGNTQKQMEFIKEMRVPGLQIYKHFQPDDLGVKAEKQWGLHGPWYAIVDSSGKVAFHTQDFGKASREFSRLARASGG